MPFLAPFTGADPMRVFNRYVYNMRASYADELEKIVEHFAPLGITRFSIVHYDDVVGRENYTAVERALKKRGLTPVSVAAFKDRAKPDIAAGVKEVTKGSPDVVILTTLYKASADFIKLARRSGLVRAGGEQLLPRREPARQGARHRGRRDDRRHGGAAAHQALAAGRAGVPGRDREAARAQGVLVHLARVVHRRQGDGRGAEARRPAADARGVHAGARRPEASTPAATS